MWLKRVPSPGGLQHASHSRVPGFLLASEGRVDLRKDMGEAYLIRGTQKRLYLFNQPHNKERGRGKGFPSGDSAASSTQCLQLCLNAVDLTSARRDGHVVFLC